MPYRKPDPRPKWNDPDLPVIRIYTMANGTVATEIDPDYERRYRAHVIETSPNPNWKSDPTYNLRRRRR